MSRIARSRPNRVVIGVGAAIAALLLSGCGAGQLTGTSTQGSSGGGADAAVGDIVVRDAEIQFGTGPAEAVAHPVGSSAPLQMHIVNEGATADRLVFASSPFSAAVQISGTTDIPAGQALVVGGTPTTAVPGTRTAQITMTGLVNDIRAGLTYPVVLTFQNAGSVTLDVPVDNPTTPREPAAE